MKKIIIFLAILLIALWVGQKLAINPGYLLMAYGHWVIEMPLWLGIGFFILSVCILYFLFRMIHYSSYLPTHFRFWTQKRALKNAETLTNKGLIALAEGYWNHAENYLIKAAHHLTNPLINYLASAQAAQALGKYEKRDEYLRKAHAHNPEATIAIGLTQAQLQLSHKQYEQALATLKHLRELVPSHQVVLKLLKKVYIALKDWQELYFLIPAFKKNNLFPSKSLSALEIQIYQNVMQQKAELSFENLMEFWNSLANNVKNNGQLLSMYSKQLIENQQFAIAESLLRNSLKKHYNEELLIIYGSFIVDDGKRQLNFVQSLLKDHKTSAAVFYILGKITKNMKLWGQALSYFEQALSIKTQTTYYLEMAEIYDNLQDYSKALNCFRTAFQLEKIEN